MSSLVLGRREGRFSKRFAVIFASVAFFAIVSYCFHLQLGREELVRSTGNFHWKQQSTERKPTSKEVYNVSMSLVIPCHVADWHMLGLVLESVAAQTVLPDSTIVVLSREDMKGPPPPSFDLAAGNNGTLMRKDGIINVSVLGVGHVPRDPRARLFRVLENTQSTSASIASIPNFKHFLREGAFPAGANRMFGANQSDESTEVVSFFDCDDYQHPRRIEYLAKAFAEHPDLDAAIHALSNARLSSWYTSDLITRAMRDRDFLAGGTPFLYSYKEIQDKLPVNKYVNGEPTQVGGDMWWFPVGMNLDPKPALPAPSAHNGWLTVRKRVLAEVPYPETLLRGQDSLYNWRLIRAKKNWNFLPVKLGIYLHP